MSRIDNINQAIITLHESERVTKETLRQLSREVLFQLMEDGDIRYANKIITVLTPVNRRAWIAFMQEFSGFQFDEDNSAFTKKDKSLVKRENEEFQRWQIKQAAAMEALVDPAWSIWPWSEQNLKVEASEFTLDKITKGMQSFMKKADKNGFKQPEVIKAVIAAGLDMDTLMAVMDELTIEEA